MAITLDSDSEATTNVSPLTFNHTAGTGARIVVISIAVNGVGAGTLTVTYGGTTCTQVNVASNVIDLNNTIGSGLFYLLNPPAGTNVVSVGYSATSPKIAANASSWFGDIDESAPFFDKAKDTGTSSDPSVSCPTQSGNVVIDACAVHRNALGATIAVDASQTQMANQTIGIASIGVVHGASYELATLTATTMSWTITTGGTKNWTLCTMALQEKTARLLSLLGVGI